jgi:protein tyrosine phosphatase type 4A
LVISVGVSLAIVGVAVLWCCHYYFIQFLVVIFGVLVRLLSMTSTAMSRDSGGAMKVRKPEPAEIEYKNMRFLITYRPTDATMDRFVEELKKHNVKDVVRVCDPTYNTARLLQEGITVMDLPFDDGTPPPDDVVSEWFNLLRSRFTTDPSCCVAVHCIAGLGRAPVLVALALIELGMKYEDAVELIREKRRGAINAKQLAYLERYHPKSRLKSRNNGHHRGCLIM